MNQASATVVRRLWDLIQGRRWEEAGALLADDVVIAWPHSGELIRGRTNYVELNRHYPEGWHMEVLTVMAEGDRACIELRAPHETMGVSYAACFYDLRGGLIQGGTEYWVEEKSQAPPAWRARCTERV